MRRPTWALDAATVAARHASSLAAAVSSPRPTWRAAAVLSTPLGAPAVRTAHAAFAARAPRPGACGAVPGRAAASTAAGGGGAGARTAQQAPLGPAVRTLKRLGASRSRAQTGARGLQAASRTGPPSWRLPTVAACCQCSITVLACAVCCASLLLATRARLPQLADPIATA